MHYVMYVDGSHHPGTECAGSGLFGYSYKTSDKPKNISVPIDKTQTFTQTGIRPLEDAEVCNIEVVSIFEKSISIFHEEATNNGAEVLALMEALRLGISKDDLESILIRTDSNYVVTTFNERMFEWAESEWRTKSGKLAAHHLMWKEALDILNQFKATNKLVTVEWVKGHSSHLGNNLSDLYASMGTNKGCFHLANLGVRCQTVAHHLNTL